MIAGRANGAVVAHVLVSRVKEEYFLILEYIDFDHTSVF